MRTNIRLSELVLNRRNPRRVKPERDAHRRLVASIRAYGLLQPLVVRPAADDPKSFRVIAGQRRLAALREVHRGDGDPKIACEVRDADDATTEAIGLAENFAREPMHPLDEAEAFARLAREDAKGVDAIAADFGVTERYVRQRMKLATLADVVKVAYRDGGIDTGTAEVFAAVPPERQEQVWQEVGGNPQHAHHVRNVIEHGWIDAAHALFNIGTLPEPAVSRDLFGERVLIERQAFLAAQAEALEAERSALAEDGWAEVVVASQSDVQDRLWSMEAAPVDYDDETTAALAKLDRRRQKWEAKLEDIDENDEAAQERIGGKPDACDDGRSARDGDPFLRDGRQSTRSGGQFLHSGSVFLYSDRQFLSSGSVFLRSDRQFLHSGSVFLRSDGMFLSSDGLFLRCGRLFFPSDWPSDPSNDESEPSDETFDRSGRRLDGSGRGSKGSDRPFFRSSSPFDRFCRAFVRSPWPLSRCSG